MDVTESTHPKPEEPMNSLTQAPLSTLLPPLFASVVGADAPLRAELGRLSPDARTALLAGASTDYRAFYGRMKDAYLPVSEETGRLLYLLARTRKARSIVEYGTSFGLSTLHLAAALKDNGGGRIIGSEFEPGKVAQARANIARGGLLEYVEIREGDALETLSHDLPEAIDLVLLDGAKILYSRILDLLEPRLAAGAVVVADNADDAPEYVARVRDPRSGYLSVPFGKDVELSLRA
jgi:predicted O-methyltransferase YrrM